MSVLFGPAQTHCRASATNENGILHEPSTRTKYTYDYNGNTLTKVVGSNTTSYAWDYENRMTSVTLPGSGGTVTFKYDPFGRRIYKSSSSATSVFAYDGDNMVEETNSSGTAVARYADGLNIDEPLAMLRGGATSFYHADGLGSVTSLSNTSGSIAQTYTFDSFGNQTASTGSLTNPFRYTARESDTETGLYYYRARYYDPSTGRFLSEDAEAFGGSIDFYAYVQNNPLNFSDPFGLYRTKSGVPPPNPRLDRFMKCMDSCTGQDQVVTATTNGKHQDPGHAAGTTVDIRPLGSADTVFCCAGQCGAPYLLDERKLKTKFGSGAHFHIQLVAPHHPNPRAPNSIPSGCRPGGCTNSSSARASSGSDSSSSPFVVIVTAPAAPIPTQENASLPNNLEQP